VRRRGGVYLGAAVLAALIATGLGASLASAGPSGATAGPGGQEPPKCERPEPQRVEGGDTVYGPIEGSRHNDVLRSSRGGKVICAYGGSDSISAKNRKADEIVGGPGLDTAKIDGKDTVWPDVEQCPGYARNRCPRAAKATKLLAASQVQFFKEEPIVVCDIHPRNENRRLWIVLEPRMRAADTTVRVDWQTVAYRAILYRHDGTDWRVYRQSPWLFDRTFDLSETATTFYGNFWRRIGTRQRDQFPFFYADNAGTYRVTVKYYWYKTLSVAEHEVEDLVDYHFGEFETDRTHQSCTFP
jgi:hypothetical protein